ncbi:HAD family hydrolase [Ideonella sp. A 288]|uniref:HAD family hydrolase n=1 Tax=Ideonella sp. A 288 TaxID=1962181 RepID=UPI000B4B70D3|nr:HAD family hydrolase [Ideonella sp. A 288]
MRFVDQFQALFFDMNGTFMFDHDRLGRDEDFFATYRKIGGRRLAGHEVRVLVMRTCDSLRRDYDDPACFDSFPSLLDAVKTYGGLHGADAQDIADVIAAHEVGQVPSWAARTLQAFATTHPLALVTNVWAPQDAWRDVLARSGVSHVFQHQAFSSTIGVVKPSPQLFLAALQAMKVDPAAALFIGDSVERDIRPAKQLGFSTVLVGSSGRDTEADLLVSSIAELLGQGATPQATVHPVRLAPQ